MEANTRQLLGFRAAHPRGASPAQAPVPCTDQQTSPADLLSTRPGHKYLRALSIPPFLIPAALDALHHSHYATITKIVPGEAEAFCAAAVRNGGGTILTGDSDLLVHDVGKRGCIALFLQIGVRRQGSCQVLEAPVFRPHSIAARLGLENLRRLAFEVQSDRALRSLLAAKSLSLRAPANPAALADFDTEYLPSVVSEVTAQLPAVLNSTPCFLDPRLSELVFTASLPDCDFLPMYLPPLIEDPTRSSAWAPSEHLRQILYSILTLTPVYNSRSSVVQECYRKGSRVTFTAIDLLPEADLLIRVKKISAVIRACLPSGSWFNWWNYALTEVTSWYTKSGKAPPRPARAVRLFGSIAQRQWADVHLEAQVQGVLFWLRMIKQLLGHLATMDMKNLLILPAISELRKLLRDLPNLDELIPPYN